MSASKSMGTSSPPDQAEVQRAPVKPLECSRRVVLAAGLSWGALGCAAADGRGAGAPVSPEELERRNALLRSSPEASAHAAPAVSISGEPPPVARASSLPELEKALGGRVGVYAFVSAGPGAPRPRAVLTHRADELFAMCSTFKSLLVAAALSRVDAGEWGLNEELPFSEQDLDKYAPVAEGYVAQGRMPLETACAAAVSVSDNTAANLLLRRMGGPTALTTAIRSWGDEVTRLDRTEPALNSNLPGDARDTTSPHAMATSLARLLESETLRLESRLRLTRWLTESTTGARRLRAGLPKGATVGGKTGTGNNGACHDVIVYWPSGGAALYVAAYLSESSAPLARLEEAQKRIGELALSALEGRSQPSP